MVKTKPVLLIEGIFSLTSRLNGAIMADNQRKIELKRWKTRISRNQMKPEERHRNILVVKKEPQQREAEVRRANLWDRKKTPLKFSKDVLLHMPVGCYTVTYVNHARSS